jgi:hypothetical protein
VTAVCPSGGASSRRGGIADHVIITAAYVASFAPPGLSWLLNAVASGLGIEDIETATFCAIDPPADPGLDAADGLAIVTAAPEWERPGARDRLAQLVRRFAWYQLCQCTTTGPLAPPTPPTVPTGWPAVNPPGVVGIPAGPCFTEAYDVSMPGTETRWNLATNSGCDGVGQPTCASLARPLPAGAKTVQFSERSEAAGHIDANLGHTWQTTLRFYNGATFVSQTSAVFQDFGNGLTINHGVHSANVAVPATATHYVNLAESNTSGYPWTQNASFQWFCSTGDSLAQSQNCCTASDPITQGQLAAILQLLTISQRQTTPFAYISGAAHHALTGSGVLTVQGILGALLNVSVPASYGLDPGTPDTYFGLGYIRFGTVDGYASSIRIDTDSQVIFPDAASVYTLIAYNLEPGVSMTLTELIRES